MKPNGFARELNIVNNTLTTFEYAVVRPKGSKTYGSIDDCCYPRGDTSIFSSALEPHSGGWLCTSIKRIQLIMPYYVGVYRESTDGAYALKTANKQGGHSAQLL